MPAKKPPSNRRWSMYPNLHPFVTPLLLPHKVPHTFHPPDDPHTPLKQHDTNIMGRFTCHNPTCSATGWSSRQIAITIRLYSGARYNARVYHQRCRQCNGLSRPWLDGSCYGERVAYRVKKWCGIAMERPVYGGKSEGPHQRDLCEGCKEGHCSQA